LFAEFIRDFIKIHILSDISPEDIKDISERFLPLFQEGRDSDTVKRINLKGNIPLFIIAIIEHQSEVSYRTSFKMLQYITFVLADYEKEANKKNKGASELKPFKYPPVLPVVFYDGPGNWTAETDFLDKVELNDVFYKYIPKFEYEVVRLEDYSVEDLVRFGDTLSLIMIIDKIRTADGISMIRKLPPDYIEKLKLGMPPHLGKLLADVITVLLKRINIPDDEIEPITAAIHERRLHEMFQIENYDVQETRRIAREEGIEIGEARGEARGEAKTEADITQIVKMFSQKKTLGEISAALDIPVEKVRDILRKSGLIEQAQ